MNKPKFIPLFVCVLITVTCSFKGFAQVHVTLKYPSQIQFVPSDLWNITATNTSSQSQTVYLIGTVKDNGQNLLLKVTSNPITVPSGTHSFSPSTISTASINYFNNSIQQDITHRGQFPAGEYVSCIAVYGYSNNTQIDGYCVENSVEIIHPPRLVGPSDKQVLDNAYPVFEWSPAYPLRPAEQVGYQIKIVELSDSQPPMDGIERNPAFYQGDLQNSLLLSYSYSNLPFDENKTYAWQITASVEGYPVGGSEIWSFTLKPKPVDSALLKLNDNYLLLNDKTDGAYYLANGCVKFRFVDQFHAGVKSVKLLTSSEKDITPRDISLKRPFNDDRYVIDLRNISDIEDKNYYLMQVNTISGQLYTIRFRYTDPEDGQ